jgi:hypothetical protein
MRWRVFTISGWWMTTSNDILSLLIYLGLVTTFLRLAA